MTPSRYALHILETAAARRHGVLHERFAIVAGDGRLVRLAASRELAVDSMTYEAVAAAQRLSGVQLPGVFVSLDEVVHAAYDTFAKATGQDLPA